jgi:hypothetical protein
MRMASAGTQSPSGAIRTTVVFWRRGVGPRVNRRCETAGPADRPGCRLESHWRSDPSGAGRGRSSVPTPRAKISGARAMPGARGPMYPSTTVRPSQVRGVIGRGTTAAARAGIRGSTGTARIVVQIAVQTAVLIGAGWIAMACVITQIAISSAAISIAAINKVATPRAAFGSTGIARSMIAPLSAVPSTGVIWARLVVEAPAEGMVRAIAPRRVVTGAAVIAIVPMAVASRAAERGLLRIEDHRGDLLRWRRNVPSCRRRLYATT